MTRRSLVQCATASHAGLRAARRDHGARASVGAGRRCVVRVHRGAAGRTRRPREPARARGGRVGARARDRLVGRAAQHVACHRRERDPRAARVSESAIVAEVTATRVQRERVLDDGALRTSGADGRDHSRASHDRGVAAAGRATVSVTAALTACGQGHGTTTARSTDGDASPRAACRAAACTDDATADVAGVLVPDSTLVCGATCAGDAPAGVLGHSTRRDRRGPNERLDRARLRRRHAQPRWRGVRPSCCRGGHTDATPARRRRRVQRADRSTGAIPRLAGVCADHFPSCTSAGDAVLGAGAVGQGVLLRRRHAARRGGARFAGVVIAANDIEVGGAGAEITGVAFAGDADGAGASRVADGGDVRFCELRGAARRARCAPSDAHAGPVVGGAALTRDAVIPSPRRCITRACGRARVRAAARGGRACARSHRAFRARARRCRRVTRCVGLTVNSRLHIVRGVAMYTVVA